MAKAGVAGKTNLAEPKQKLRITISGRKAEYINPPSPKAAEVGTHEGLGRLNITRSGKRTPPTGRAPDFSYQESSSDLAYTVATKDYLQSEFAAQGKGLVQKSSSSARLERQSSREEFLEEDKVQFRHHDLFLERGSRFPRPASHAPLKAPTIDERLSRVLDYVNETYSQNNLNTPNAIEYEASTETPAQTISKVSDTPPPRDIQKDKNSSIFHSATSNDSDDSPLSDARRKRIKYVGQPMLYTAEEKEILEERREGFRNLAGVSEHSLESDSLNESQMPAFSDSVVTPE